MVFDQGSDYDNTTGLFTAPVTGRYYFYSIIRLFNVNANHTSGQMVIQTSPSQGTITPTLINPGASRTQGSFSNLLDFGGGGIMNLSVGDTVDVDIVVNDSTLTVGVSGTALRADTLFCGKLIA